MENKELQYVMLLGYGWSGSSAIVDLLKEFKGYWAPGDIMEFRILRDPYGVMNLESHLIDHWDPLVYDMAIRDFIWYSQTLNKTPGKFTKEGGYYDTFFGKHFLGATEKFVQKLTDFTYDGYWFYFDFKLNALQNTIRKIKRKLNKTKFEAAQNKRLYFSNLTREQFYQYVQEYMDDIFEPIAAKENATHMIMDQAIPVQLPTKSNDYFKNAKTIIVDRDPRDIYVELIKLGKLIGKELKYTKDPMKYVEWHKAYRRNVEEYKKDENILFLQFEDIVQNYDENVKKILDFLGEDESIHLAEKKRTLFNPDRSIKNIGIWRNYEHQDEMQVLYDNLTEYCYQGK